MQIKEASEASGLSVDTIRYYERMKLLPSINRDAAGLRQFTGHDIEWMTIIYWLRKTGMPMKIMSRYAFLIHDGDHTIPERVAILRHHKKVLAERRADLDQGEALLAYKLAAYEGAEEVTMPASIKLTH